MKALTLNPRGLAQPSSALATLAAQLRLPLQAWSTRRRTLLAALIAVAVCTPGALAWWSSDVLGLAASHTALERATQSLADARHKVDMLPKLRREMASLDAQRGDHARAAGTADDVRLIARLASRSGLVLLALEPDAASGASHPVMRPIRLAARADFEQWMRFLRGLPHLPMLVVPDDVLLRRNADTLSVSATLRVFGTLTPVTAGAAQPPHDSAADAVDANEELVDQEALADDPFGAPPTSGTGVDAGEDTARSLVGVLIDRVRGVALFELAQGVEEVGRGQWLGDERLVDVSELDVTLERRGNARKLGFAKAAT